MRNLIKSDPKLALELAVPVAMRSRLPDNVAQHLEERVNGRGFYGVMIADNLEEQRREITREVVLNGKRYNAYVYGARLSQVTQDRVPLHGIAIGNDLAVHADPLRPLEMGEAVPASAEAQSCPVSGLPASTYGTPAFAEVGGKIESFCGAAHLFNLNERLAADDGVGGDGSGSEPPIANDGWTQGPRTVLYMRVNYPDDPTEAITEPGAYSLMDTVNSWFTETSYDTTALVTDVTPLMTLPQSKAWYCENGDANILSDARELARSFGYDTDNYNLDIVRFPSPGSGCNGYGYGGKAYVRGKGCWMLSNSSGTMIHELGHNYGVWHANFWTGVGEGVITHGSHVEYGNPFDVMGSSGSSGQFNAAFKNQLDWLQDYYVQTVTSNGTYRIYTYDVPSLAAGQKYALKIRKDYDRNYWAEFRQKYSNRWFLNGVILNWDPWNNGVTNSASGTHLLDTTPSTPTGNSSKDDAAVVIGRTYSDHASGVHITPLAKGNTSPENWIDVAVNLGNFFGNNSPSATITADRTNAGANVAVNFSTSASDADGDALAYYWDFGDLTFGSNSPNTTKSWAANGEYVVRCTVTDMKGGTFSRHIVITVGSPATFRISGRILSAGTPLEGVRVHNGLTGAAYRGTYTDSDGYYVIANLAAGSYNLSAVKYGYVLTLAGWSNPVSVGPHATNLDFEASKLAHVGIAVTDASASEAGSNPGTFTFTRSGTTNTPLTVKLNRTGSATINTDYTLNPAPTGSPLRVTFPIGVSSIDVMLNPASDSTSEGPETVTLTLIEDAAYVLAASAETTITLADDEAPVRPTVSVSASNSGGPENDNVATESGLDTGVFRISRAGNVGGELMVHYAVSGTASNGVDYTQLFGLAAIPAGQTVVTVPFNAIDDVEVEGNETVTVTLLTNAAYTVSGSSSTVTILDDDPTAVLITATDNLASESSGNNATVVFTRIGSLAANLVVNYTLSGSASNTSDFSTLSGSVTILAGRPNIALTVTPVNDSEVEGDETLTISVASSAAYNVANPGSATLTIQDNEIPTVTLTVPDSTAGEAAGNTGSFSFARTGSTSNSLTVYFSVSGNGVSGADYTPVGNSIDIPAGSSSAPLLISPLDDAVKEGDEKVIVQLANNAAYNVGTVNPLTVTIKDNDSGLPAAGFNLAASSGPESDTSVQLSVQLTTNSTATGSVNFAVSGGSATGGGIDYTLAGGTLNFPPGEVNRNIVFSVNNDILAESNETLFVTLSSPTNAQLDAVTTHVYTILDDDGSGTLTVSAVDANASETGPDPGRFRITRSLASTNDLAVFFQVIGSASSPTDYLPMGSSITIPATSNFVEIVVMPEDDATDETNETVTLNLLPSPGAKLGSPDIATVIIADNDDSAGLPIVSILAPDPLAAEPGADTGTFVISRDRDTNSALSVTFTVGGSATSGTDFNSIGTSVIIPAGADSTSVTLTARDDILFETNETVVVTLTTLSSYRVTPAAASATTTISDDEIGVSISATGDSAENGSSTGIFTITRTGSTASNLTVNFTVAGTANSADYDSFGTSIVIQAGTNAAAFPLTAVSDGVPEGNETVVVTLAAGAGYTVTPPNTATVVLLDGEPGVTVVASDDTAYESGADPGAFTFTRTGGTNAALTVLFTGGGTASNGVDYALITNAIVIEAGQTTAILPVLPIDDAETEGSETVQINLATNAAYVVLAPSNALVTILDDEINLPPVATITSPTADLVHLPGTDSILVLEAGVNDDGRPNPPGATTASWTVVSFSGGVMFAQSNALQTTVKFSTNGLYVLRVTVDDSQFQGFDEVTVIVGAEEFLSPGLVAHWRFDETNGPTALDASGNNRNAAVSGALFTNGGFNNALDFDGVDDVASFSSPALAQLTVSAWMRSDSTGDSTTPRVVAMPGYNVRVRRDPATTPNAVAFESERSTTTGEWRTPGNVVFDGAWYHVLVAYDSGSVNNTPLFYVNGDFQPATVRTAPVGTQLGNTGTGYIGNSAALDRSFDGRLDEVRLYNRLLNANEIRVLAAGPATNLAPLVDAGPDQTVNISDPVPMNATVIDDGRPNPPGYPLNVWSKFSGPGEVEFADEYSEITPVTFSAPGTYVLRLTSDDSQVKIVDDVSITVMDLPVVTIVATDDVATEHGLTSGAFTLTRNGPTNQALSVRFELSGTAVNGTDYSARQSGHDLVLAAFGDVACNIYVNLPEGAISRQVLIIPLPDNLAEGEENVIMTLLPEPSYVVGSANTATVILQDLPWDAWRYAHFTESELTNATLSGEQADPDSDRRRNLLEYAFDSQPKSADPTPGFSGALEIVSAPPDDTTGFVVTFKRRKPPTDLVYEVEVSSDFENWLTGPSVVQELQPPMDDENGVTETVRVHVLGSLTQPGQKFARLKVTRQ